MYDKNGNCIFSWKSVHSWTKKDKLNEFDPCSSEHQMNVDAFIVENWMITDDVRSRVKEMFGGNFH